MAMYNVICITCILLAHECFGKTLESIEQVTRCTYTVPAQNGRCPQAPNATSESSSLCELIADHTTELSHKMDRIIDILMTNKFQHSNEGSLKVEPPS